MLSESDAALIARDPSIAGLKLLLDSEALYATLAEKLPELDLVGADTEYLRYKPGNSCLARIRLHGRHRESSAYAMAYQNIESDKLRKAAGMSDATNARPILLPEYAIALFPFPLDRRLPSLGRFMHRGSILDLVQRAAPALLADKKDVEFATLHYKPERRYVAQLSEAGRPFAALKMYSNDGFDRAWRATKIIGGGKHVGYARCIGHSERHKSLLFDWIHGLPLSEIDANSPGAEDFYRQAAVTLRNLHSIRTKKLPTDTLESVLRRLAERVAVLTWLSEDLADAVRDTCETIARRLSESPPTEHVTIHGDLHLKQFVVDDDGPRLLDFDRTRLAEPAQDFGSLLGYFRRRTTNSFYREEYDDVFERFVDDYEAAGGRVDRSRLPLYAAFRLIEYAVEPFRSRHPEWVPRMRRNIDAAQQLVGTFPGASHSRNPAANRSSGRVEVTDPFNIASDERLLAARDATDPYITAPRFHQLASVDGEHAGIVLKCVSVIRHRPGRRCVIEYAGRSCTTGKKISLIGKINAKDRHHDQFDRQVRLWNSGFSSDSTDGVSVARPWAVIPEWRMWLCEKARGHSSWRALQGADSPMVAKRFAYALAKLHNSDLNPKSLHTIDTELGILEVRLNAAADQVPHLADRVLALLETCRRVAAQHRPSDLCPVHRDFYPDQVLVDGERIVLLDFDLLRSGEAAVDIGNLRAHLTEHALRYPEHKDAYAAFDAAFVAEYARLRPTVTPEQVAAYTFLSLARHVSLCMSKPSHHASMLRILDACEQLLQVEAGANGKTPLSAAAKCVGSAGTP